MSILEKDGYRSIIARSSYSLGNNVLVPSQQVTVLLPTLESTRCHTCFKIGQFKCCSKCKYARYCSTECQRSAWNSYHSRECSALCSLPRRNLSATLLLAIRLMNSSTFNSKNLSTHYPIQHPDTLLEMERLALSIKTCLNDTSTKLKKIVKILSLIRINATKLYDEDFHDYGLGVFYPNCYINHSCNPNCVSIFINSSQYIKAIREISPGEEVTIAYCDIMQPKSERRAFLYSLFNFECHCARCESEDLGDIIASSMRCEYCPGHIPLVEESNLQCSVCQKSADFNTFETALVTSEVYIRRAQECKSLEDRVKLERNAREGIKLHPGHEVFRILLPRIVAEFNSLNNWSEALKYAEQQLKLAVFIYPQNYPPIAIEHYRVARLLLLLSQRQEAIPHLISCYSILSNFYDEDNSSYLYEVRATFEALQRELETGVIELNFS